MMNGNKSVTAYFRECGVDVSAYATSHSYFAGYADRLSRPKFPFATGKEFLEGLAAATAEYHGIRNLYVFSHAWHYHSPDGISHGGGFLGNYPVFPQSGFYGQKIAGDHADARQLSDLSTLVASESIKFITPPPNTYLKLFLEGCHVDEIGSFAASFASLVNRSVTAACGASSEYNLTPTSVTFRSAAENSAESTDPDWDRWRKDGVNIGRDTMVP